MIRAQGVGLVRGVVSAFFKGAVRVAEHEGGCLS